MDWKHEITTAWGRIDPHIRKTPVMAVNQIGSFKGAHATELKLEHLQHTASFKARGAFNSLLCGDVPDAGVVAASGGNHGAAVAYAARTLGCKARIYVPELAGETKINLIRRTGADLQVVPGAYANAADAAEAYQAQTGAMQIHAYDAPLTVAGQGTVMAEWEAMGCKADTIMIAVGGGGLIGGCLAWLGGNRKVVAVEPETCPTLHTAKSAGQPTDIEVSGIAANALGARRIGQFCFDLARDTQTVLVSDKAIAEAQKTLWQEYRLLVEPAGATALAALTSGAYTPAKGERIGILICGGNIAPEPQL